MTLAFKATSDMVYSLLHNALHRPAKRRRPLFQDNVKVIRHYDVCEELMTECRNGFVDVICDRGSNVFGEPLSAALGPGGDVEPRTREE